jgi:hypothetical protein
VGDLVLDLELQAASLGQVDILGDQVAVEANEAARAVVEGVRGQAG